MEIRRISLLGHKDHGKSTLIGNLLMLTESIPETRIQEARRASNELGVEFEPAYLLDTFSDERAGGMTYDNTRAQVLFEDVGFELIDVPGHEELIKSMLSGASNSDFSLVVVSTKKDEGITDQTKRHIYVSRLLGMSRYVVAVNKMDATGFDEKVFESFSNELTDFFKSIGISEDMFSLIPVSAYSGDNILTASEKMPWYHGNTLLNELKLRTESRPVFSDGSGRIILQSSIKFGNKNALLGEVLTGTFKSDDNFRIFPGDIPISVNELRRGNDSVKSVKPGDGVALITGDNAIPDLRGLVVTNDHDSVKVTDKIEAKLFFIEKPNGSLTLRLNNVGTSVSKLTIKDIVDPTSGAKSDKSDIDELDIARVGIITSKQIACDSFQVCRQLGRVILYSGKRLIGAGIITGVF